MKPRGSSLQSCLKCFQNEFCKKTKRIWKVKVQFPGINIQFKFTIKARRFGLVVQLIAQVGKAETPAKLALYSQLTVIVLRLITFSVFGT